MEIQGDQRSGRTQLVYGGLKKVPWAAGKGLRTQWYETPGEGGGEGTGFCSALGRHLLFIPETLHILTLCHIN